MRRALTTLLLALAALTATATATTAHAAASKASSCTRDATEGTLQRWTCQWGPVDVAGYEVRQALTSDPPHPPVDGGITHMDVDVTDAAGTPIPIRRLMLHHIVFLNLGQHLGGAHDRTCADFTMWDAKTKLPAYAERFYAAGEERATMDLPAGYGYPLHHDDSWALTWMFMNHRAVADRAFIRYHVTVDTSQAWAPVVPYWLDVANCNTDPVYDVAGGGRPGSTDTRSATFTLPEAGRVVAAGGHVHGGARDLTVRQPACGDRALWTNTPAWGLASHPFYNVRPILHEPGPIAMSAMQTPTGIPLAKGAQIRLDATYDASRPHTRVMGIDIAYVAPDASVTDPCAPLPQDITTWQTTTPHRTASPRFVVPINPPTGRTRTLPETRATIGVRDNRFTVPKAVVRAGTTLTWRFKGLQLHNVTVADGPRGFSSANLDGGRTYKATLTVPGTYKLYCGLHPMAMTETVKVRPRRSR